MLCQDLILWWAGPIHIFFINHGKTTDFLAVDRIAGGMFDARICRIAIGSLDSL